MAKVNPAETQAVTTARGPMRSTLASKSNAADSAALRAAPGAARTAIANFRNQNPGVPAGFGSADLVGLMALIYTYLKRGTNQVNDYPKSMFPLLGITSFGTMFGMLPADDQNAFAIPQDFEDINLDAAGFAGTGGTAVFAGGFANQLTNLTVIQSTQVANALGGISRSQWLQGIAQGNDLLTVAATPLSGVESMGKLARGENVGRKRIVHASTKKMAPIIELRRMQRHLTVDNWKDFGLDVFDAIVALNDLKKTQLDLRRYDPANPK